MTIMKVEVEGLGDVKITDKAIDAIVLNMVYETSYLSNDPRTKIGAMLCDLDLLKRPLGGQIIGGIYGWNHLFEAYRDEEKKEKLKDRAYKHKKITHAEDHAISQANKFYNEGLGISPSKMGLWVLDVPCNGCSDKIIKAKIPRVVTHLPYALLHVDEEYNSLKKKKQNIQKMQNEGIQVLFYPLDVGQKAYMDNQEIDFKALFSH